MTDLKKYACKRAYLNKNLIANIKADSEFLGESTFTDYVLSPENTDKNLKWVRHIQKNNWPNMKIGKYYPFFKKDITWKKAFQIFRMPVGSPFIECNSLDEARKHLSNLEIQFSFERTGLEYKQNDLFIYIEDVENIPLTIEVVCKDENNNLANNMKKVELFLEKYNIKEYIPHQVATLVKNNIKTPTSQKQ